MANTLHTAHPYILYKEVTNDPASLAANTTVDLSLTVAGVLPTHHVQAWCKTLTTGLSLGQAFCDTANTVKVPLVNSTAGALDQASSTFFVLVR